MQVLKSNKAQFEYDIHSLVKAFYPEWDLKVVTPKTHIKDRKILDAEPVMELEFGTDEVVFKIYGSLHNSESRESIHNPESRGSLHNSNLQNGLHNSDLEEGLHDLNLKCGLHNEKSEFAEVQESDQPVKVYRWQYTGQAEKKDYKNAFKRFLYTSLREETGIDLPWGNLTGIRPTKIALTMLEQGKKDADIEAFLREMHFVSKEKAALGIEIAKREREILSNRKLLRTSICSGYQQGVRSNRCKDAKQFFLESFPCEKGYSLYIGIPFCPTTCLYCSFTSYPIHAWRERVADYLTALEKEMRSVAQMCAGQMIDTVYIGGGTPTSLSAQELERLLLAVRNIFDLTAVREFTVEAGRADSITEDKLRVLRRYGVTRISVNPQTMKQETLKLIGRQHTVEQVVEAFHLARETGFDNINMDIILGLPGETQEDVAATIQAVKELAPDSLTVHSLAVKRASGMGQWIAENGATAYNNTEETMRIAAQGARDMGMAPYYLYRQKNMSGNFENVGYAKEGKYGIYNILIMEEVQTIAACGAGTITKRVYPDGRIERCDNVKDVALYISKIEEMIDRKSKLLSDCNL